jgi:dCTP deaminase
MALLSAPAIQAELQSRRLVIDPMPGTLDYSSDAVDVHLGNTLYVWRSPAGKATLTIPLWRRLKNEGPFVYREFASENLMKVEPDPDGIVTLRPGTFYLADLRQYTKLPPDIAMHIEGKSSLARLGVCVHITAPHAHAGWSGHLTLEILNSGPFNIELKPGIAMGQLTFWRVEQPLAESDLPTQQFSNQQTARG